LDIFGELDLIENKKVKAMRVADLKFGPCNDQPAAAI
jgi:hypothetical protein